MIVSSVLCKTIEVTDHNGQVYLLVSDGPDTSSGKVLRKETDGHMWQLVPPPHDEQILFDYVQHEILKAIGQR